MRDLSNETSANGRVPKFNSLEDLIDRYARSHDRIGANGWVAAYIPDYARFDTGEQRRKPLDWNRQVPGMAVGKGEAKRHGSPTIWFIREPKSEYCNGYVINIETGQATGTSDPAQLGYTKSTTP